MPDPGFDEASFFPRRTARNLWTSDSSRLYLQYMTLLPSGTVTFLFTDIEGSTRSWEEHPAAMASAVQQHDAVLRACIGEHGGVVFKMVGDACCAAFDNPEGAVRAILAAHRALAAEEWSEVDRIRIRSALHTGVAQERDGDYFGQTLNRVARLLSAGHGGQTLLSGAVQELVRDHLPSNTRLVDLGEHRLRDLVRAEHIFQLVAPDLPVDFPRLKTLDAHPTNLPLQATPLIGREREVAELCGILRQDIARLITLTGPGGTGKTRLAVQAAAELLDEFPDGVYFVPLAAVRDAGLVTGVIADALSLSESRGEDLGQTVRSYLKDKKLLLVLDNFEQVIGAAQEVSELLSTCPELKGIVTSRSALRLYGEREFGVSPLEVPDLARLRSRPAVEDYPSVTLFVQRAQAVKREFGLTDDNAMLIAEICTRLDGLPLAIELAAARVRVLPVKAIHDRLSSRLSLLTGGARDTPARQQTLRGAIEWSYELLEPSEQLLFRRLAVFSGGCTLDAMEAICSQAGGLDVLEVIGSLVDKSLVRQAESDDGEPRFAMLETIREYAFQELTATGESEAIERIHFDHFLDFACAAKDYLNGPEQALWLTRIEREHDNLRSALDWSLRRDNEAAARLAVALLPFWQVRSYFSEGRHFLEAALGGLISDASVRGRILQGLGSIAYFRAEYGRAVAYYEESLEIWRELGEKRRISMCLNNLGNVGWYRGEFDVAKQFYRESLALDRELGDEIAAAKVLGNLGSLATQEGNGDEAWRLLTESLTMLRKAGDRQGIATGLLNLAEEADRQGNTAEAEKCVRESADIYRDLGNKRGAAICLQNLGQLALSRGDTVSAAELYRQSLTIGAELGDAARCQFCFEGLAIIASQSGDGLAAARLWGAAEGLRDRLGIHLPAENLREHEEEVARARAQSNAAVFDRALSDGKVLSRGRGS